MQFWHQERHIEDWYGIRSTVYLQSGAGDKYLEVFRSFQKFSVVELSVAVVFSGSFIIVVHVLYLVFVWDSSYFSSFGITTKFCRMQSCDFLSLVMLTGSNSSMFIWFKNPFHCSWDLESRQFSGRAYHVNSGTNWHHKSLLIQNLSPYRRMLMCIAVEFIFTGYLVRFDILCCRFIFSLNIFVV